MTSKPTRPGSGPPVASGQADDGLGTGQPVRDAEVTWATSGYLGAIFLGPVIPLFIYVIKRKRSRFMRYHAAMALNLSLTWTLYAVCCVIIGSLLVLDSLTVALVVVLPIAFVLWLVMLKYLIRGVGAANRAERYAVPGWISAQIAK